MLYKTLGIALKTTNYADNGIIAHIFTEAFGMQSYLINAARKPKARISANLFQPLHLLDLIVYHKESIGLQRIKEARQYPVLKEIPLDITKSSMAIFLNEILYKLLRQQSPDSSLFNFIQQSIIWLDETDQSLANFHLVFLIKLSRFLGFLPLYQQRQQQVYFNLLDGVFCDNLPVHGHILQEPHTSIFLQLLQTGFKTSYQVKMSKEDRKYLLEKVLEFYRLHTENFGRVHSFYILEEIFH